MATQKVISTEANKLVIEIMKRALFYNNTSTCVKSTGSKPTFFTYFYGNGALFEVSIYPHGWGEKAKHEHYIVYLAKGTYYSDEDIKQKLTSIIKRMEDVYAEWCERKFS